MLGAVFFKLLDALMEVQCRYASVSGAGAIAVAITPDLYRQIDDAVGDAPCPFRLTPKGRAAVEEYRKERSR
jgi:hypothetical protein